MLNPAHVCFQAATYDSELMKVLRERDELQCRLDKSDRHVSEIQANVRVLTAERDKTKTLYRQVSIEPVGMKTLTKLLNALRLCVKAQDEIADLRRQMMRSKVSQRPKYSVTAHSILKRLEAEKDEAMSDLHRMSTERDSLRERLKVQQHYSFHQVISDSYCDLIMV